MIGYGSIPIRPPALRAAPPQRNEERMYHREVRAVLVELGFTEVYNYSFVNADQVRAFGFNPADHIPVANPFSADQGLLRLSLLPGLRRNIEENSKQFDSFRLFEIGREIRKQRQGLPSEVPHLAAAVFGRDDGQAGLMELKRVAGHLMPGCEVVPSPARSYEHPVRAAEVHWLGQVAGRLFRRTCPGGGRPKGARQPERPSRPACRGQGSELRAHPPFPVERLRLVGAGRAARAGGRHPEETGGLRRGRSGIDRVSAPVHRRALA